MAFALENFLFCLDLKLGGILCAWWGMIISSLSIISVIVGLSTGDQAFANYLPLHIVTNNALISGLLTILILVIYLYFSYRLLLGAQHGHPGQMVGYLIIHGVVVVLFILAAVERVYSVIGAVIYLYLWFTVYSLYVQSGGSTCI